MSVQHRANPEMRAVYRHSYGLTVFAVLSLISVCHNLNVVLASVSKKGSNYVQWSFKK